MIITAHGEAWPMLVRAISTPATITLSAVVSRKLPVSVVTPQRRAR